MAAKVSWSIHSLSVKPKDGEHTDVVVACGWACTASDGGKEAVFDGTMKFDSAGSPFVAFKSLKEQDVLGWCWANGVDKQAAESKALAALQNLLSPPVVQKPLPWAV